MVFVVRALALALFGCVAAQDIFLQNDKPAKPVLAAGIDAHVLDISIGKGAGGVHIDLDYKDGDAFTRVSSQKSQDSGRTDIFEGSGPEIKPGVYRLTFHVEDYFKTMGRETFFPEVVIHFRVKDEQTKQNFHVPITLSEFGYSTYRGV
eukprot:TRINITY_DN4753_c1_g1_i1.p2 TRINITY_DN4753_c1_g1~~TRINITY_DN4753_c1_g1_i1.p2  ORF type:complete len:149 (-),score=32.50 TRINITY_DN4753_c1_g1_i1:230-676(-)